MLGWSEFLSTSHITVLPAIERQCGERVIFLSIRSGFQLQRGHGDICERSIRMAFAGRLNVSGESGGFIPVHAASRRRAHAHRGGAYAHAYDAVVALRVSKTVCSRRTSTVSQLQ